MNVTIVIPYLLRLMLLLLVLLWPLFDVLAQDKAPEKERKMRVKIFRSIDGEMHMADTLVSVSDYSELPGFLKNFELDTAAMHIIWSIDSLKTIRLDTGKVFKSLRSVFVMPDGAATDTALFNRVKDVNVLRADSTINSLLKGRRLQILSSDSARAIYLKGLNGDTIMFRSINPAMVFKAVQDSSSRFRFEAGEGNWAFLHPQDIDRIIVRKNSLVPLDSILMLHAAKVKYKVIVEDSTGHKRIVRIDADGNEHELKVAQLNLDGTDGSVLIFSRAKVKSITAEDKAVLEKLGAPVETEGKNELALNDVSFYPNPSNGRFTLDFKLENKGNTTVKILNSQGEEVFSDILKRSELNYSREIDIRKFGQGLYFLQIAQGKKYLTKKILVQ